MNFQKQMADAYKLLNQGQIEQALQILKKLLKKFPANTDLLSNYAVVQISLGNYDEAFKLLKKTLALKFDIKSASNLIKLCVQMKNWQTIINLYEKYEIKKQKDLQLNIQLAIAYRELGDHEKAMHIFNELLKEHPSDPLIYISYGFTLNRLGQFDKAIEIYRKGLEVDQDNAHLNYNIGITYANINLHKKSAEHLIQASKEQPNNFNLWITLAAQQNILRDYTGVKNSLDKCRDIDPKNILIPFQYGVAEMQIGNLESAKKLFIDVLRIDKDYVEANYHLGLIYLMMGEYKKSNDYYKYRAIRSLNKYGRFDDLEIENISENSKIIIGWEQGIGDQLIFLRLLSKFIEQHKNVTLILPDKLCKLIAYNFPEINVINTSNCEDYLNKNIYDIKINLGSLIRFSSNIEESLKLARKLKPMASRDEVFKNDKKVIGLSWKSNNAKIGNEKSFNLSKFIPIIENNEFNFISLQYGDIKDEIDNVNSCLKNKIYHDDCLDYFDDIDGLCALISKCDLVITTSNITAHLSGSMGIKTYVLVPNKFGKLWYWFSKNNKSIWYPSVEIIQQDTDGEWEDEILKIKKMLEI